jgi:predicted secreted hydrolase
MTHRGRYLMFALLCTTLSAFAQTAVVPTSSDSPHAHYAPVLATPALAFPRDHGAHPGYRTEWWYVTGWLDTPDGPQGFQITFFRTQPYVDPANPSAFAPRQILFAHAALADPAKQKLMQGQRIARQGFGLAEAASSDTDIVLDDWSLKRKVDGQFDAKVSTPEFAMDLSLRPTQPVMLQGNGGYSQKGPLPEQASYYYSLPHLAVSGHLHKGNYVVSVSGEAWFDHEWSSNLLDPRSVGWDWTGLNLDDGSSVMAFQVRDAAGKPVWAGGGFRDKDGKYVDLKPGDVAFAALRRWHSPRTGANYPVQSVLSIRLPSGMRRFTLSPLFDDQELDTRATGGPIYWEGAVRTTGGRGYLELVGYAAALQL